MNATPKTLPVVWITGGGTGIGRATALQFARSAAAVVVSGRRAPELDAVVKAVRAAGGNAEAQLLDVTDADAAARVAAGIEARHGRVDILVNSAGTNIAARSWEKVGAADFRRVVDVNLNGALNCILPVLPGMRARGGGTIVNVSSWAGYYVSKLTGPAYGASKRAMIAMNESLNLEECANGIRACVVCPGEVATEILNSRPKKPSTEDMERMLQADDVARTVFFICELPASAAIHQVVMAPTWNRFYLGMKEFEAT
jgi:NADP-dependent 3-hydroxy acid dehydrogenase YdfG